MIFFSRQVQANSIARYAPFQFISLLFGVIYLGQELNQEGVMNINGALFLLLTNMTFQNVFSVVNVSPNVNRDTFVVVSIILLQKHQVIAMSAAVN